MESGVNYVDIGHEGKHFNKAWIPRWNYIIRASKCSEITHTEWRCQEYTQGHHKNQKISICHIKYLSQPDLKLKTRGATGEL